MDKKIISVIVPIYNTEKYLRKCVDSIINQTYSNLQIILVNDGSPDNSLEICREYEKKDSRIVVVNKSNGGLSSARNAGIDMATGDYIAFVDSDDYLELDAYEILMNAKLESGADIVFMGFNEVDEGYHNVSQKSYVSDRAQLFDTVTYLSQMCLRKQTCSVCNGLFNASLVKVYRFDESRLNEDYLFLAQIFIHETLNIAVISYRGYCYLMRPNSISRNKTNKIGKSSIDAVYNGIELKRLSDEKKPVASEFIGAYAAYQARTAMAIMPDESRREYKKIIEVCRNVIKENIKAFNKHFPSKKDRIFCKFFVINPAFALACYKIIHGKKV